MIGEGRWPPSSVGRQTPLCATNMSEGHQSQLHSPFSGSSCCVAGKGRAKGKEGGDGHDAAEEKPHAGQMYTE